MLKAARDRIENLMRVVEKQQRQQSNLSLLLQDRKKSITAVRLFLS
ncbi:unnamed protein product, partial [Discosporangium mesarthrocarpum]